MTATKLQIAELRRQIKNARARFAHLGKTPRKNPVFEGAAIGFRLSPFDIRSQSRTVRYVHSKPTLEALATVYPCTRQRLHQISKVYGREILSDPELMASVLTNQTKLQTALADPKQRAVMAAKLKTLTA